MRENYYDYEGRDKAFPSKIYIEPTDMCNLNCSICFRHGWIDETPGRMDMEVFHKIANEINTIRSVKEVFFGGMGEPLFHPDIVEMIKSIESPVKKSLLTNASLLSTEMSEKLIEAGLDELWISMDGFCSECYEKMRLGGQYEKLLGSIDSFNSTRQLYHKKTGKKVDLGITFVITGQNAEELRNIDDFADKYNVDEINISHMIPGYPIKEEELLHEKLNVPVGKMHRLKSGSEKIPEDECPFISKDCMFIRRDGDIAPCMQLLHSCRTYLYEEERIITRFAYGNVKDLSIMDCWNDEKYVAFRGRVKEFYFPFCRHCTGCDDRKGNLRDCFLAEAPTCGACIWASGKVFCP